MSPKTPATYRIDPELIDAMNALKERDGIPISEQVRRALRVWLESKGMAVKSAKPARGKRTGKA